MLALLGLRRKFSVRVSYAAGTTIDFILFGLTALTI